MGELEALLAYLSSAAARGAPESAINAELQANGYSRQQFEDAVRSRIESKSTRPDKNMVDRAVGTLRELFSGRTLGFAEPVEALVRMMNDGAAPGLAGMGARFLGSGLSIDEEGSGLLRSRDYENIRGDIAAERDTMQRVLPGQSAAAEATGFLQAGAVEGAASNKLLPALTPKQGQTLLNVPRRAGEAAVAAPPASAIYSLNQYDPRFDVDPTQSLGGDPNSTVQGNMARDTLMSMAGAPILGPVMEGAAKAASRTRFVDPERVAQMQQPRDAQRPATDTTFAGPAEADMLRPPNPYQAQTGGAGTPPVPPTPPVPAVPFKGEYDPYYMGLTKYLDALSSDQMTPDMAREIAQTQARLTNPEDVQAVDVGGINVQRMGKAMYNAPGTQADIAQQALEGRQLEAGDRIMGSVEQRLSGGKDPEIFRREQAEKRRTELNPEFQKIMDVGLPDSLNPNIRQLLDLDPRIAQYYQDARSREDLRGNQDPGEFDGPVNLRMIETARRGISNEEKKAIRAGDMDEASALGDYRRRLMAEADAAVPQYGELRRQGFDSRRMEELSEQGAKDFRRGRPEVMRMDFMELSEVEKNAYRAGFVRELKAYLDPKISDSATKGNIAGAIDKRSLKERIEVVFDSPQQFQEFWEGVMVEARRSKSYISTIGDATRNTGEMQRQAANNLVDPNVLDEVVQGFAPMERLRNMAGLVKDREIRRVSEAFGPQFFRPGLDNTMGLLNDAELADQMRKTYNRDRAQRSAGSRAIIQSLLD